MGIMPTLLLNPMVRPQPILVIFAPHLGTKLSFTSVAPSIDLKSNIRDQVLDKYFLIDCSGRLQAENSYIKIVMMMINTN